MAEIELWGGPHDGAIVELYTNVSEYRCAVPVSLAVTEMDEAVVIPEIHTLKYYRYVRHGVRPRNHMPVYKYEGIGV